MRIRLAPQIAAKVEGVRVALQYPNLSLTANLLLDAITRNWDLKLTETSSPAIDETRIQLDDRHKDWLTNYGTERGLNVSAAANLVISEYFRSGLKLHPTENGTTEPKSGQINQDLVKEESQQKENEPPKVEQPQERPRGGALLKGLKLNP